MSWNVVFIFSNLVKCICGHPFSMKCDELCLLFGIIYFHLQIFLELLEINIIPNNIATDTLTHFSDALQLTHCQ